MPEMFLFTAEGEKKIIIKDNWAYFEDETEVPEKLLAGFRHRLFTQEPFYNAKFVASLTHTPYYFWQKASEETKEKVLEIFRTIRPQLLQIREEELSKVYTKRVESMNQAKQAKKKIK